LSENVDATPAILQYIHPRAHRLIVDKPKPLMVEGPRKLPSGLYAPAQEDRYRREFGCSARVLKIHPDDTHGLRPGDEVLIPEFSGSPIYLGKETPYWIVGEGDVMAVIDRA